ncbi:MAG: AMP-binding protein, partial [Acidobacteriota bacterium]
MSIRDLCASLEAHAARTPDAIAIEDADGTTTTYAALCARSMRVAGGLRAAGVDPTAREDGIVTVGLALDADADYVAAFFGALMAGGVPMPLDVDAPPARQQAILRQAQCRHVVAAPRLARDAFVDDIFDLPEPLRVAALDQASPIAARVVPKPLDPCYVQSTSGSTGTPKAILGNHRGLAHFLTWEVALLGADAGTRASMLAPITFDVHLRDMLVPLCAGGTLCLPGEAVRTDPRRLRAWLDDARVTTMHIVPTLFRLLLAELRADEEQAGAGQGAAD